MRASRTTPEGRQHERMESPIVEAALPRVQREADQPAAQHRSRARRESGKHRSRSGNTRGKAALTTPNTEEAPPMHVDFECHEEARLRELEEAAAILMQSNGGFVENHCSHLRHLEVPPWYMKQCMEMCIAEDDSRVIHLIAHSALQREQYQQHVSRVTEWVHSIRPPTPSTELFPWGYSDHADELHEEAKGDEAAPVSEDEWLRCERGRHGSEGETWGRGASASAQNLPASSGPVELGAPAERGKFSNSLSKVVQQPPPQVMVSQPNPRAEQAPHEWPGSGARGSRRVREAKPTSSSELAGQAQVESGVVASVEAIASPKDAKDPKCPPEEPLAASSATRAEECQTWHTGKLPLPLAGSTSLPTPLDAKPLPQESSLAGLESPNTSGLARGANGPQCVSTVPLDDVRIPRFPPLLEPESGAATPLQTLLSPAYVGATGGLSEASQRAPRCSIADSIRQHACTRELECGSLKLSTQAVLKRTASIRSPDELASPATADPASPLHQDQGAREGGLLSSWPLSSRRKHFLTSPMAAVVTKSMSNTPSGSPIAAMGRGAVASSEMFSIMKHHASTDIRSGVGVANWSPVCMISPAAPPELTEGAGSIERPPTAQGLPKLLLFGDRSHTPPKVLGLSLSRRSATTPKVSNGLFYSVGQPNLREPQRLSASLHNSLTSTQPVSGDSMSPVRVGSASCTAPPPREVPTQSAARPSGFSVPQQPFLTPKWVSDASEKKTIAPDPGATACTEGQEALLSQKAPFAVSSDAKGCGSLLSHDRGSWVAKQTGVDSKAASNSSNGVPVIDSVEQPMSLSNTPFWNNVVVVDACQAADAPWDAAGRKLLSCPYQPFSQGEDKEIRSFFLGAPHGPAQILSPEARNPRSTPVATGAGAPDASPLEGGFMMHERRLRQHRHQPQQSRPASVVGDNCGDFPSPADQVALERERGRDSALLSCGSSNVSEHARKRSRDAQRRSKSCSSATARGNGEKVEPLGNSVTTVPTSRRPAEEPLPIGVPTSRGRTTDVAETSTNAPCVPREPPELTLSSDWKSPSAPPNNEEVSMANSRSVESLYDARGDPCVPPGSPLYVTPSLRLPTPSNAAGQHPQQPLPPPPPRGKPSRPPQQGSSSKCDVIASPCATVKGGSGSAGTTSSEKQTSTCTNAADTLREPSKPTTNSLTWLQYRRNSMTHGFHTLSIGEPKATARYDGQQCSESHDGPTDDLTGDRVTSPRSNRAPTAIVDCVDNTSVLLMSVATTEASTEQNMSAKSMTSPATPAMGGARASSSGGEKSCALRTPSPPAQSRHTSHRGRCRKGKGAMAPTSSLTEVEEMENVSRLLNRYLVPWRATTSTPISAPASPAFH